MHYGHRCQLTHSPPSLLGYNAVALTHQGNSHNRNFSLAVLYLESPTSWYLHRSFLSYFQVLIRCYLPEQQLQNGTTYLPLQFYQSPYLYFSSFIFTLVYLFSKLLFNSSWRLLKALWAGHTIPIGYSSQIVSPISWFCQAIYIVWQLPFFGGALDVLVPSWVFSSVLMWLL